MTIDKRINYAWGGPGGKSPGTSPSGGTHGGGYGRNGEGQARDRHPPAPRPAPRPYKDPDPISEVVPGDVNRQNEIREMIRDQALEKMDYIPDDITQLDLNKFGEAYEPVKPDLRTQKEKDEDFERSIDWDKVKDLSKKGYDFKEIQDAMNKGLLTKEDPQSMRTNLLDRGIRSIRNIIPKTGLEKSLLSRLTKNVFAPTEGGMFDPKRIGLNLAKNYAMKKLGLGALNPFLGIASLFGFDPFKGLTNKFARKPVDMSVFSKLGLHANRFPTATDTRTAKAKDAYTPSISTQIAGGRGLESGAELLGLSDVSPEFQHLVKQAKNVGPALIQMRNLERKIKAPDIYGEPTEEEKRMYKKSLERDKEEKIYRMPILTAAYGGRIDKPLTGRSRDI